MRGSKKFVALLTLLIACTVLFLVFANSTAQKKQAIKIFSATELDSIKMAEANEQRLVKADSMISFSKKFMGKPYFYTGKTPTTGFDCSGFTHYVFKNFGIELSPASKEQIFAGKQINLAEAQTGDLLVFTGTRSAIRQPGHVGIVISKKGERPLKFIHSSSVGGVKISQVDGTNYAIRLLQVRRLLL